VRKLFWMMMVSLDGYAEGPKRQLDWHVTDGDFPDYVLEMLRSVDALLLGRITYELFASYWPTARNPEAALMNGLPKIVFSRRLGTVDWVNARLVDGDAVSEVEWLKRQPGRALALLGSADLARTFLRAGLIDEIRTLVNPVVIGAGRPMFKDVRGPLRLTLTGTRTLSSGVVVLTHAVGEPGPAPAEPPAHAGRSGR